VVLKTNFSITSTDMLRKIIRKILPNPFDRLLISSLKKNRKNFLIGWNRGIGDIPLGLYALVQRIKWFIPDAKITFMIRPSLFEGFQLFPEVDVLIAPKWRRGEKFSVKDTLAELKISQDKYDVIIEKADPTYWVQYQLGRVRPYLTWNKNFDKLHEKFDLKKEYTYVAVQTHSDTFHSPWRDFPEKKWRELFNLMEKNEEIRILLFGLEKKGKFKNRIICDLRGKTTLLDLLSIIKNKCDYAILPDGGILSLLYFLDVDFPIHIVSLWSDIQGVLKQNVESPNKLLKHTPIIRNKVTFHNIEPDEIITKLEM
jgi:ADP-heptose:LPS heptosyltransferase